MRAIVVVVVLRRRKEWSSSSSSKRGGKIIDFHSADSLREFQFKWPTTRRRRPNKSRRRLMVVVRLRRLHKHPPPRNTTKTLYYPWGRKSQRWTGPCTRPASCPFYSAFTSTLVPMMRSESRWSLEFAFELVAVFLLFFIRREEEVFREEDKNCCPILTLMRFDSLSYYYYYYYEFDHPQQRRNHHHRNIVATVNLDCKLDLKTIAFHARNVEYNPKVRRRRRRARRAIHLFSFCVFLLSCGRRERKERTSRWNGTLTYLYAL